MWIREPRKVSEEIEYLGTTEMCIYLLKGREYIPEDIFCGLSGPSSITLLMAIFQGKIG